MNTSDRNRLIQKLSESEGFANPLELIGSYIVDHAENPAICTNVLCEAIYEDGDLEPDAENVTCPECGQATVVSFLRLAQVI